MAERFGWQDPAGTQAAGDVVQAFFLDEARIAVSDGAIFDPESHQFVRDEVLRRMIEAINRLAGRDLRRLSGSKWLQGTLMLLRVSCALNHVENPLSKKADRGGSRA